MQTEKGTCRGGKFPESRPRTSTKSKSALFRREKRRKKKFFQKRAPEKERNDVLSQGKGPGTKVVNSPLRGGGKNVR